MTIQPNTRRYELEIPEEVHWQLVKLGAEIKMHHEDYAEQILLGHVTNELGS